LILGQSDEQRMQADSLRRVAESGNEFEKRRRRLAGPAPDWLALWKPLIEIGAIGLAFDEAHGGFGGGASDIATMMEALGPSLLVEPVVASAVTAGRVLMASEGQPAATLIEGLIVGERIPILAHAEGFDPFEAPSATARPTPGGFVLNGMKPAVRGADVASDLLVSAALPDGAVAVFIVPVDSVRRTHSRLIDGAGMADVELERVEVASSAALHFEREAMDVLANALEWTLAALCVETAALIVATNRATFNYLGMREQFGQKLATFQALQHRAADMAMAEVEAAALASDAITALALPPSPERSKRMLLASLGGDVSGRQVGHEAVQMHGGMGVSDELIISHFARRFTAIRNQVGTADARQARVAEMMETLS
jgi:alkylation response protein AidB-like acyl-CoA dehydrogenase